MSTFNPAMRPSDEPARHRYIHVIGASVFVDDRPADREWGVHFLGMLGDEACWGVDVPRGEDPSDGAAVDLYSLHARTTELDWAVAGRAVFFTTTNGTRALLKCRTAKRVLAGALVNRQAVVNALRDETKVRIVCAGTRGEITRDDALYITLHHQMRPWAMKKSVSIAHNSNDAPKMYYATVK